MSFWLLPAPVWVRLAVLGTLMLLWGWVVPKFWSPSSKARSGCPMPSRTEILQRAERARAVKQRLGDRNAWAKVAEQNAAVATTLSKLGAAVSARLIRHGYATTMANGHVILNYPLLDLPVEHEFMALVE